MPSIKRRILVVEDDQLILMNTRVILEEAGYTVIAAANAVMALSQLEAHPGITAMFTDIAMPGRMDGLALAAEVHRRWPQVDVYVTSGRTEVANDDLPPSATFLAKPYTAAAMLDLLAA